MTDYERLVAAMKALSQEPVTTSEPAEVLPVAENGWNTRPDADSYGVIALEFEAGALRGDDRKVATAYEGGVDLFSLQRSGAGWVELITGTLEEYCDGCWRLESFQYENETGLFHWEWVFQVEG